MALNLALAICRTAQSDSAGEDARPGFKPLRYNEDYRFLADPAQPGDWWDPVKYIPVARGQAGYLSVGGEDVSYGAVWASYKF